MYRVFYSLWTTFLHWRPSFMVPYNFTLSVISATFYFWIFYYFLPPKHKHIPKHSDFCSNHKRNSIKHNKLSVNIVCFNSPARPYFFVPTLNLIGVLRRFRAKIWFAVQERYVSLSYLPILLPFEEEEHYGFILLMSVGLSARLSVDQIVSYHFLEYYLS